MIHIVTGLGVWGHVGVWEWGLRGGFLHTLKLTHPHTFPHER